MMNDTHTCAIQVLSWLRRLGCWRKAEAEDGRLILGPLILILFILQLYILILFRRGAAGLILEVIDADGGIDRSRCWRTAAAAAVAASGVKLST